MKKLKPKHDLHVFVCHGGKCSKRGASDLRGDLRKGLRDAGVSVRVSRTTCQGQCKRAPVVFTEGKKPKWWGEVSRDDTDELVSKLSKPLQRAARG